MPWVILTVDIGIPSNSISTGRIDIMSINHRKSITTIISFALIFGLLVPMTSPEPLYAASRAEKSKVTSYKKSIKSYYLKTRKIAKVTKTAGKTAKRAKSYYKKSRKTSKLTILKTYRAKTKALYNKAKRLDYIRKSNDIYKNIQEISKDAPSMKSYVSKAKTLYTKAKKAKKLSTSKKYFTKIRTLERNAKKYKSTLTWFPAVYKYVNHPEQGHYQTVTTPAKYEYMIVTYFVWIAMDNGFPASGGEAYNWNLETCIKNGAIIPLSSKETMKDWGCIAYMRNGELIKLYSDAEFDEYCHELTLNGIQAQWRETGEWFKVSPATTSTVWIIDNHAWTEKILVKNGYWG
jgi:hypothetical protein